MKIDIGIDADKRQEIASGLSRVLAVALHAIVRSTSCVLPAKALRPRRSRSVNREVHPKVRAATDALKALNTFSASNPEYEKTTALDALRQRGFARLDAQG